MSEMEEKDTQQAQTEATTEGMPEPPVQEAAPEPQAPESAPEPASPTAMGAALEAIAPVTGQSPAPAQTQAKPEARPGGGRPEGNKPRPERQDRPDRRGAPPQRTGGGREGQPREGQGQPPREGQGQPRDNRGGPDRGGDRGHDRGPRREGGGRPDLNPEIDLDKLVTDSLYLDNQAHAVVARMRDMDSGTRSQLRRMYSAIRRACRAAEVDRQHQFVMLRARLAYTIARHQLRSLDVLEKLLLQVTRRNEARSYERFRDLFEAIVAYNE
jgi:CRISPR type III-A-associated protein Csm2